MTPQSMPIHATQLSLVCPRRMTPDPTEAESGKVYGKQPKFQGELVGFKSSTLCVCMHGSSSVRHSLARKAQGHTAWLLHAHLGRMLPLPLPSRWLSQHQQLTSRVRSAKRGGREEEKLCLNSSPRGKLPHRHLLKRTRDPVHTSSLGIPQICRGASASWVPTSPPSPPHPCMQLS